jgi:hypothetical protein
VPLTVSPTLSAVYTKLRAFVLAVVPANVEVVRGIDNRVPMPPASPGFVNMTATLQQRLRTNVDTYVDPVTTPGDVNAEQGTRLTIQLDCYGADSGNWATMLSTLLRSDYGCTQLAPDCAPLYADEPRMLPLVDAEREYEQRWLVGAVLQYNPTTSTPMEFADTLDADLVNVDEQYPP